jgi:hypothetical protein
VQLNSRMDADPRGSVRFDDPSDRGRRIVRDHLPPKGVSGHERLDELIAYNHRQVRHRPDLVGCELDPVVRVARTARIPAGLSRPLVPSAGVSSPRRCWTSRLTAAMIADAPEVCPNGTSPTSGDGVRWYWNGSSILATSSTLPGRPCGLPRRCSRPGSRRSRPGAGQVTRVRRSFCRFGKLGCGAGVRVQEVD